jgi:transcriptional regulator with XRE-family HTH domain
MSELAIYVGERVREEREGAGMSQMDMEHFTGIKRPNIARIESGKHMPSLYVLERIAITLGVPVSTFVQGAPTTPIWTAAE